MDNHVRLKAVKPVLTGYINEALLLINDNSGNSEKVVHDVRVLMKRGRAALKLIAPQIDAGAAENEIKTLKEVGRSLSAKRETSVLRKALKDLRKKYSEVFDKLSDNNKLNSLFLKPELLSEEQIPVITGDSVIIELLRKSGYRMRFLTMTNPDPVELFKELERTYNIAVDAYLVCRNDPKAAKLHNFRKRSKDFLYQLYFFRPVNYSKVKSIEKKTENFTRALGKYNDLSQLISLLDYKYSKGANKAALDELIVRIKEEQDSLLAKVWPSAFKIFCPGQNLISVLGFKILVI